MTLNLTPKQENFCQTYIETGNASEAYRFSYNAANMKNVTINRKAKELLDNGKITARLAELQNFHAERHAVTIDSLTNELIEAQTIARREGQAGAFVAAVKTKAQLHGLLEKKVKHTGNIELTNILDEISTQEDLFPEPTLSLKH